MGASSSSRRVSFGVDGQQRVTVLQGLRLSDNLITRLNDLPQPMSKSSSSISAGTDAQWEGNMALSSSTKEELYQRYGKEKVMIEDDLSKFGQQEQVETITELGERATSAAEQQDIKQLNTEYYRLASAQFNEAATIADTHVKRRNYEPLCIDLQSQILHCYQQNPQLTLKCSDFAKEYQRCIREAQKALGRRCDGDRETEREET
ncbi:MICOS complex subunit mic25-b-like isoform X3 [Mobula hypostoma]|uniref:MICOS complex subunit mic25-b-like isoform X3 n=1 Tax=Mobula hypostoma TaxID=723540 RepID=UPI002FC280EE